MLYEAKSLPAFVVQAVPANDDVGTAVVRWDKYFAIQIGPEWFLVSKRVCSNPLSQSFSSVARPNERTHSLGICFHRRQQCHLHGSTFAPDGTCFLALAGCMIAETFDVGFARPNRSALKRLRVKEV